MAFQVGFCTRVAPCTNLPGQCIRSLFLHNLADVTHQLRIPAHVLGCLAGSMLHIVLAPVSPPFFPRAATTASTLALTAAV